MSTRQRGAVLLLVLWVSALLAALLLGVAAAARSQAQAALYGSERVRAELAAEAGIAHAVAGLRAADPREHWVPDGRAYQFAFGGGMVSVQVVDVSGLLDLNAAPLDMLRRMFLAAGVADDRADQLAQAITLWRVGETGLGSTDSQAHGPFRALEQLAQVPGIEPALYRRIQGSLTVFSGRNFPDASYTGPLVFSAVRGVDLNEASRQVEARRKRAAQAGAANGIGLGSSDALVAGYGGEVARVFSTAVMPDGTRVALDASLRMTLTGPSGHPYKVLSWRADSVDAP